MPTLQINLNQETMGYVHVNAGILQFDCTDSPCSYTIAAGVTVTLISHPYSGYSCTGFDDYGSGNINCATTPTCTFIMPNKNFSVRCNFKVNDPVQPTATNSWWFSGGTANPMQGCTLIATMNYSNATPRSGNCAILEIWAPGASGPSATSYGTTASGTIQATCTAGFGGYWTAYAFLWNGTTWVEFSYAAGSGSSWRIQVQGAYTLTLQNSPVGGGGIIFGSNQCIAQTCTYNLAPNTRVILSAYTNTGYTWGGWTGDITGCSGMDCDFYMTGNKTVKANYTQIQYCWISVASQPGGSATCSPTSCKYPNECVCGTSVTITATPEYGYEFTGWAGDYTGMTNPATFPLNQDMSVTAKFQYLGEPWTVSPINLVFDATPIGECTAKILTVTNNDVGPMNISLSSDNPAFTFPSGTTFILLPSMALSIPIMFCPETIGEITGAIIIACTAGTCNPTSWTIAVTGQGTTPPITGACCIGTTCNITTPAACTGTFIGEGTTCSPDPCAGCEELSQTECLSPCYWCDTPTPHCQSTPCEEEKIICWRCNGTIPESQEFPEGTICGQGAAINYPETTQPSCGAIGCLPEMCTANTQIACQAIKDPSDPTKNCCYWYSDFPPFVPATCHATPQDKTKQYMIYGGIALTGLAIGIIILNKIRRR